RARRGVLRRGFIRESRSWRRRRKRRNKSLCTLADLTGCNHAGRGGHPDTIAIGSAMPTLFPFRVKLLAPRNRASHAAGFPLMKPAFCKCERIEQNCLPSDTSRTEGEFCKRTISGDAYRSRRRASGAIACAGGGALPASASFGRRVPVTSRANA